VNYYWPTFATQPVKLNANLNAGFHADDFVLWQCLVPRVSAPIDFQWRMLIFQAGFTSEDHLLSCSSMTTFIEP